MSTLCPPEDKDTVVRRRQKDGTLEDVRAPPVVLAYNKFMGGVDLADQLRRYYTVSWKSKKWWRRIFYFLLDQTVCNAYILMRESLNHQWHYTGRDKTQKSKPITHLDFQKALAVTTLLGSSNVQEPNLTRGTGQRR